MVKGSDGIDVKVRVEDFDPDPLDNGVFAETNEVAAAARGRGGSNWGKHMSQMLKYIRIRRKTMYNNNCALVKRCCGGNLDGLGEYPIF